MEQIKQKRLDREIDQWLKAAHMQLRANNLKAKIKRVGTTMLISAVVVIGVVGLVVVSQAVKSNIDQTVNRWDEEDQEEQSE